MLLRNGKTIYSGDKDRLRDFNMRYMDIIHVYVWCNGYETVMLPRIRDDFRFVNANFEEMFGRNNEEMVVTLYKRSAQLTADIIDMTYFIEPTDDEKSLVIQTLAALEETGTRMGRMLFDIVRSESVSDRLYRPRCEYGPKEYMLYRCLSHMYDQDVGDAERLYGLHSYTDGEYSDVELYDWYIDYESDNDDPYVNAHNKCFNREIHSINCLYWR
jgi:hypothetical protein